MNLSARRLAGDQYPRLGMDLQDRAHAMRQMDRTEGTSANPGKQRFE